jgi:hypothetical protein
MIFNIPTRRLNLLIILFLLFNSCKKNKTEQDANITGTSLAFNVSGITEFQETNASTNIISENASPKSQILTINNEFEALTSTSTNQNNSNKIINKLSVSKLPPNITYRIELFKVTSGVEQHIRTLNKVSNAVTTINDTIGVQHNSTYKWYAYSYNDTAPITNTAAAVSVPMGNNKDFLYASGTIVVDFYNNKPIEILFSRKTARIQLEFDGRGVNADAFTALNVNAPTGFIKTANFNLKDNAVVGTPTNITIPNFTIGSFTNVNGTEAYRKKSAFFYTVVGGNAPSITTTGLTFNVKNNYSASLLESTRSIGSTGSPVTFPFNSSIEIGKSTLLKIDLLESGLKYIQGVNGANIIEFARSNLYRHSATGDHRYRFYPENVQIADPNAYFSFGGHIPLQLTERSGSKDPCALVYPAGRWKTATLNEINSTPQPLVGSTGLVGNLLGGLLSLLLTGDHPSYSDNYTATVKGFNSRYINYNNYSGLANSQFSATSNILAFPLNGEHVVTDLVNIPSLTLLSLNLGDTYGRTTSFWTRESTLDIPLLGIDLGGWSYFGGRTLIDLGLASVERSYAFGTPYLLAEVTLLGINVLSSNFKNIRCTRNTSWDPNSSQTNREPTY